MGEEKEMSYGVLLAFGIYALISILGVWKLVRIQKLIDDDQVSGAFVLCFIPGVNLGWLFLPIRYLKIEEMDGKK